MLFSLAAIVVLLLVASYAIRTRAWASPRRYFYLPLLLAGMLLLAIYAQSNIDAARMPDTPLLIAIVSDVSLSMGTLPEPGSRGDVPSRLERAQGVLLPLLASLSSTARPTMASVIAFTSRAETILAWDDDLSLAEEIIEFVLSTGLLTEAGSDVGAALAAAVPLYESLPEAYRDPDYAKYLILVSDGEQTAEGDGNDTALARLRELGVRIIALHVGLSDVQEGLPVYDDDGDYLGFEEVGGQIFSSPNPELMRLLAGSGPEQGLFVQAEASGTVGTIADYVGLQTGGGRGGGAQLFAVLLLWGLLMFILLRTL